MPRAPKREQINKGDSWLVSFSDLITTLLCFFIILSVLVQDQSGLKLYEGLQSFRKVHEFQFFGMLSGSKQVDQKSRPKPKHSMGTPDGEKQGGTPDRADGEPETRSIDGEEERLQKYLAEIDRLFSVKKLPAITGRATVDFYEKLHKGSAPLTEHHREFISQVLPLLRRKDYQVQVVVWATMPSESAWLRALRQAEAVCDQVAKLARLENKDRKRLVPVGRIWPHSDLQRPVMSLFIAKTGT
ncbi:MAG: hypothetical protein KatS3mg105_0222 [Gemmatales bacterium]|nr:MAG: hypothetical protein KatS3mg105_0222 [Gemmatales bacterium]